jgi:predicted nucleotidyltransferase
LSRTEELRALAQRVAEGLPAEVIEVVLTGSVSRGMADEFSDIEMLVVSADLPAYDDAAAAAEAAGLDRVDTWVRRDAPARHLGGTFEGQAVELVWWSRAFADERVRAILACEVLDGRILTADALAHGVAMRTEGALADWQERLARYPPPLTAALVQEAALMWRGYQPNGVLTIARPGERVALAERLVDDIRRIVRIVFALNRVWEPTLKRLATRVEPLPLKPQLLPERAEATLAERDARSALQTIYELAAETLALVPDGIEITPSRAWVAEALERLR